MKPMSLVFEFELEIDDRKMRVANRPGDAIYLRNYLGGGTALDENLAAGGTSAYETLFLFAWRALHHHEEYRDLDWHEFLDRCTEWATTSGDEGAVRPTDAGPSSAP